METKTSIGLGNYGNVVGRALVWKSRQLRFIFYFSLEKVSSSRSLLT